MSDRATKAGKTRRGTSSSAARTVTPESRARPTPGPWTAIDGFVDGPDGKVIFGGQSTRRSDEECEANAEFIVKACNSHDKLLAVLSGFVLNERHMGDPEFRTVRDKLFAVARAAIAAVEEAQEPVDAAKDTVIRIRVQLPPILTCPGCGQKFGVSK